MQALTESIIQNSDANKSEPPEKTDATPATPAITRDELLKIGSDLIRDTSGRLRGRRFKLKKNDGIRLQYIRSLTAAIVAYGALLKDIELDELKDRLERLEDKK